MSGNWQQEGTFYPGRIVKVHGEPLYAYDILFDDGDIEKYVTVEFLKPLYRSKGASRGASVNAGLPPPAAQDPGYGGKKGDGADCSAVRDLYVKLTLASLKEGLIVQPGGLREAYGGRRLAGFLFAVVVGRFVCRGKEGERERIWRRIVMFAG